MKVSRQQVSFATKLDMTPLIDCIFQLILFLVLTSQITIQAEDVDLPFALEGTPTDDLKDEVQALLINVVRDTESPERKGFIRFQHESVDKDQLVKELKKEALYDAAEPPYGRGRGYEAGPGGTQLSKLAVHVRADQGVRAEYVRTIFAACQAAGIYRIRISSTLPRAQ